MIFHWRKWFSIKGKCFPLTEYDFPLAEKWFSIGRKMIFHWRKWCSNGGKWFSTDGKRFSIDRKWFSIDEKWFSINGNYFPLTENVIMNLFLYISDLMKIERSINVQYVRPWDVQKMTNLYWFNNWFHIGTGTLERSGNVPWTYSAHWVVLISVHSKHKYKNANT